MLKRRHKRGLSLLLVLGLNILFFLLAMTLHGNLRQSRLRLAEQKHKLAAQWLSESGADMVEKRLQKQQYDLGQTVESPQFQHGRFSVRIENRGGQVVLFSTGFAGPSQHTTRREVTLR